MIKAVFKDYDSVTAYGAVQWDYGQTLEMHGLDITGEAEVHFAVEGSEEAEVYKGTVKDGVISVPVPDHMLCQDRYVNAYVYVKNNGSGETLKMVKIPVTPRPKPESYISTPEERKTWEELEGRLAGLEKRIQALEEGAAVNVEMTAGDTEAVLEPAPKAYIFPEMEFLTARLMEGREKEAYHFSFCSGEVPTVLTLDGIRKGILSDNVEAGKIYEVDIWNGIAVIKAVAEYGGAGA